MRQLYRWLLLLSLAPYSLPGYAVPDLDAQVNALMQVITSSGCTFIRNGKTHDAAASIKHINRKYDHFRDEITNIDEFIERTATKSLMSGKRYQVQCGEERYLSSEWLKREADNLGFRS